VDGNVVTGIVVSDTETELVVSDAQAKSHAIAKDDIELIQASPKSVMPEMLMSGMTAQQAADMLQFLSEQRRVDAPQP
jgi:putative heme-binding domain-containing protein